MTEPPENTQARAQMASGAAERLYCNAFPPEERRPFGQFLLEPSEKRGPYLHTLLLSKGISDKFAGIVTTWQFDDFMYIGAPRHHA